MKDGVVKDGLRQSCVRKMMCERKWMSPSARPATQKAAASTASFGNPVRHQSQSNVTKLCVDKLCVNKLCEDKLCVDKLCEDKLCVDKLCVQAVCGQVV